MYGVPPGTGARADVGAQVQVGAQVHVGAQVGGGTLEEEVEGHPVHSRARQPPSCSCCCLPSAQHPLAVEEAEVEG